MATNLPQAPVWHPPPGQQPPPARKGPPLWLIILAAGGVLAMVVGVIVGLGVLYLATAKTVPVSDIERSILVDAAALAAWHSSFEPEERFETVGKQVYFDRSFDVDYEYDDPAGEVYLTSTLNYEPLLSDAKSGVGFLWTGAVIGGRLGDTTLEIEQRDDLFSWGDESRLGIMRLDGDPIGNLFIGRQGKVTLLVMFSGVYSDESEALQELLQPRLDLLAEYQPETGEPG